MAFNCCIARPDPVHAVLPQRTRARQGAEAGCVWRATEDVNREDSEICAAGQSALGGGD